jgi:hypothetical protein
MQLKSTNNLKSKRLKIVYFPISMMNDRLMMHYFICNCTISILQV